MDEFWICPPTFGLENDVLFIIRIYIPIEITFVMEGSNALAIETKI